MVKPAYIDNEKKETQRPVLNKTFGRQRNEGLKMKIKSIISILFLSMTFFCNAQKIVSHNNQQWIQYYNQLKLSEKLTLYSDVSLRRINNFNQWSQVTIRTGIGYPLTENLQVVTGFACFNFYNNNKPSRIEFRPYQEVNTSQNLCNVAVQHRLRVVARYFRKISDNQNFLL